MKDQSELEQLQATISEGKPSRITRDTVTGLFSSLCYIRDISASEMARQIRTTRNTASTYCRGTSFPNLNRFVRIMDRLGYDVWITPKQ